MSENQPPSLLQPAAGRHEAIAARTDFFQRLVRREQIPVAEQLQADGHFWFLVQKAYAQQLHRQRRTLLPPSDKPEIYRRRSLALQTAVDHASELYQADKLKITDGLTGLWNRPALDNRLELLRQRITYPPRGAKYRPRTVAVYLLDIDDFKKFNDTYGHGLGDKLLQQLAATGQNNLRLEDMLGRYGGEEFGVIMAYEQALPEEEILQRAERFRQQLVAGLAVPHGEQILHTTVSMGVTLVQPKDQTVQDIFGRADADLYQAKQAGKNCTFSDSGQVGLNLQT